MAFIRWAVSDREVIKRFLKVAFQLIFAGAIRIRHGGSEERVDAVWHQFSKGGSQSQLTLLIHTPQEARCSKTVTRSGSALSRQGSAITNSKWS